MDVFSIRVISLPVAFFAIAFFLLGTRAFAQEIDGVQPAAIDQPRINLLVRRQPNGPPLSANVGGDTTFNVEAFLDTGASEVLISSNTADGLGLKHKQVNRNDVTF